MRRPSPHSIAAYALAAALGCATVPRAPDEGGPQWVRVETPHFVLESDLDAKRATALAKDLELWQLVMTATLFQHPSEPRSRLRVVALRDGETVELGARIAGMYSDLPYVGPFLLLGGYEGDEERLIKHELAHAVIAQHLHRAPQWLDEGLAAFLESTELDEGDGEIRWGGRHGRIGFQGIQVSNLEGLFAPRPWPADQVADTTFIAGRLIRVLVKRHPAELDCFLERLRAFEEPTTSMNLCFPDRSAWAKEISSDGWGTGPHAGSRTFKVPPRQAEPRTSRMTDAEIHAALALVDRGILSSLDAADPARAPRTAGFERHLLRALALDAGEPLAGGLAFEGDRVDPGSTLALSSAMMRAHPGDWRGWAVRANLVDGASPTETRDAALKAFELEPHRGEVLLPLAAFTLAEGSAKDAETYAREAAMLRPWDPDPRALWFLSLERQESCAAAHAVVKNAPTLTKRIAAAIRALHALPELGAPRCEPP